MRDTYTNHIYSVTLLHPGVIKEDVSPLLVTVDGPEVGPGRLARVLSIFPSQLIHTVGAKTIVT